MLRGSGQILPHWEVSDAAQLPLKQGSTTHMLPDFLASCAQMTLNTFEATLSVKTVSIYCRDSHLG